MHEGVHVLLDFNLIFCKARDLHYLDWSGVEMLTSIFTGCITYTHLICHSLWLYKRKRVTKNEQKHMSKKYKQEE